MAFWAPVLSPVVADLIQKRTLLDFIGDDNDVALFMAEPDRESDAMPMRLLLDVATVEALGRDGVRPEQLTVTIRPGDELNDADSAFQTGPDAT